MIRSKSDRYKQALYDTWASLPDLDLASDWRYGQVAIGLRPTTNPHSPLSGVAVYNVEKMLQTPKTVTIWAIETVWQKGKGYPPIFPYRVLLSKHGNLKLIAKTLD